MSLFLINKSKSDLDDGSELSAAEVEELKNFQPTPEESRRAVRISMFYLLVALVIGVPVWFKTTGTYQAPLPFWEIKKLVSRSINIEVAINIVSVRSGLTKSELSSLQTELSESDNSSLRCGIQTSKGDPVRFSLHCSVRAREMNEAETASYAKAITSSSSFRDLLASLENNVFPLKSEAHLEQCAAGVLHCIQSDPDYELFLLPGQDLEKLFGPSESVQFNAGSDGLMTVVRQSSERNIVYIITPPGMDPSLLTLHIAQLFNASLISVEDIKQLMVSARTNQTVAQNSLHSKTRAARAKMTTYQLPASSGYDVTLTVLAESDSISDRLPDNWRSSPDWRYQMLSDPTVWLEDNVKEVFQPWLPYVNVEFYSQRIRAVDIEQLGASRLIHNGTYRYYTQDDLSTLVNQLESYLGAPQTASAGTRDMAGTQPGLHLILLMAMPRATRDSNWTCPLPLRFHLPTSSSPFSVADVAVVPQWGGLFSVDAPSPCSSKKEYGTVIAHKLTTVIRSLLGAPEPLDTYYDPLSGTVLSAKTGHASHWQMDRWFLRRTVESLLSLKITMTSLVDLLARFPNLVINDYVADEVVRSTKLWEQVLDQLKNSTAESGNPHQSRFGSIFKTAQDAVRSADSAFFDHTLLGRLYFEESQKYGIYVPLFVPIGLGLLKSSMNAFRVIFPREST
ncbi:unnamed protein product [Calicophoron daubneyi]|uniref:GPI transamidase component PIG-S n=1 Tax=Calicophoron daubneyi TaxID=300641 RepID=A0AAV2TI51_CALDB